MNKFTLANGEILETPHSWETLVNSGLYRVIDPAIEARMAFAAALEECKWRVALDAWKFLLEHTRKPHELKAIPEISQAATDIVDCCVMLYTENANALDISFGYNEKNRAVREILGNGIIPRCIIQVSAVPYDSTVWGVNIDEDYAAALAKARIERDYHEDAAVFQKMEDAAVKARAVSHAYIYAHIAADVCANVTDAVSRHYQARDGYVFCRHCNAAVFHSHEWARADSRNAVPVHHRVCLNWPLDEERMPPSASYCPAGSGAPCLSQGPRGYECTRRAGHKGKHHAHLTDGSPVRNTQGIWD